MKKARLVSAPLLGFFLIATLAKADPADSSSGNNPYVQYDADGVPLAVAQSQNRQLSPNEIRELREQQTRAAREKNWLLRGYAQEVQSRAGNSTQSQSANFYNQLSSNPDLARLAGMPDLYTDGRDEALTFRTGATEPHQSTSALRNEASAPGIRGPSTGGNIFKPLITPLSSPEAAGMHNFYSALPGPAVTPFYGSLGPKVTVSSSSRSEDSTDIETPGMISDKNNPLADPGSSDLTLDMLPGESVEEARAHQDNNNNLELPVVMDADRLHQTQAATLHAPVPPNGAKTQTAATPPPKPAPTEDPEAPTPVSRVPQINPVRAPIASPFDILNR